MAQKQFIECPFCSGLVEPGPGRQKCPECHAGFFMMKGCSVFLWIPETCGCPSMEPCAPVAGWFKVKKRGGVGIVV